MAANEAAVAPGVSMVVASPPPPGAPAAATAARTRADPAHIPVTVAMKSVDDMFGGDPVDRVMRLADTFAALSANGSGR